jgi:hypothetical protein
MAPSRSRSSVAAKRKNSPPPSCPTNMRLGERLCGRRCDRLQSQVAKLSNVGRSAATTSTGSASENAFGRSGAPRAPFLYRKVNVAELAFYEVRSSSPKGIAGIGARYSRLTCTPTSGCMSALVCCRSAPTRREEAGERQVDEECSQLRVLGDARSRAAYQVFL